MFVSYAPTYQRDTIGVHNGVICVVSEDALYSDPILTRAYYPTDWNEQAFVNRFGNILGTEVKPDASRGVGAYLFKDAQGYPGSITLIRGGKTRPAHFEKIPISKPTKGIRKGTVIEWSEGNWYKIPLKGQPQRVVSDMQMTGKHPPRPQPTTPIPPRKTPGATVKTDTMLRQESIKELADMIFETFAAPRPGRVDPVGMQKTVTRNGVMATADIDTRYVRNNVVYASVEVVDDHDRRTAYKAIPIISHKAIRDALSKDMSYRGPSNAKAVYEGVLETALNSHFKKYPAPKKPRPRQHPQAKKAAYVAAYGKRHKAYERDAASKDIFGMTPRQQREYTRAMEKPMNGEKIESEEDYWLHQPESGYERTITKPKAARKPRAPARKKPAPKKAAALRKPSVRKPAARKPKAPAKKARPPAKKPATRKAAAPKKPVSKPTGRPQVLKASKIQTGKSDKKRDAARKAMAPGKRKSATGRIYYEYRKNRSDVRGRKT